MITKLDLPPDPFRARIKDALCYDRPAERWVLRPGLFEILESMTDVELAESAVCMNIDPQQMRHCLIQEIASCWSGYGVNVRLESEWTQLLRYYENL